MSQPRRRGTVWRRNTTWSWQFTTGSRAKGTRKHHSGNGYRTEQDAQSALEVALAKWDTRSRSERQALAPVADVVDTSVDTILGLIDSGSCTASCVLAANPDPCLCRCGCKFHGLAREGCGRGHGPLERLRTQRWQRQTAEERENDAVYEARAAGHTWEQIGEAAGRNKDHLSRKYGGTAPDVSAVESEPSPRDPGLAGVAEAHRRAKRRLA